MSMQRKKNLLAAENVTQHLRQILKDGQVLDWLIWMKNVTNSKETMLAIIKVSQTDLLYLKSRIYQFFILKMMSGIFAFSQDVTTRTGFAFLSKTIKNQKTPETMVFETLDINQQSTAIPER